MKDFKTRVQKMNEMYHLDVFETPRIPLDMKQRLKNFKITLAEEVEEIDEIVEKIEDGIVPSIEVLTMLSDLLGDVVVYCRSEAMKYGIPLEEVLDAIMDSNESKLQADGSTAYNEQGKVMKGPNFFKPEPKIQELLLKKVLKEST